MDASVSEVVRDGLAADLVHGAARPGQRVELETPKVRREEHDPIFAKMFGDLGKYCRVVALHVPITIKTFAVGKRRRVDDDQIELWFGVKSGQKRQCIG